MRPVSGTHRPQAAPGQALVEFAIIVSVVLLLGFGVFEVGRAIHAYVTVTHAAREGARALAAGGDDTKVRAIVNNSMSPLTIDPATDVIIDRSTTGQASVRVRYAYNTPVRPVRALWGGGALPIACTLVARR